MTAVPSCDGYRAILWQAGSIHHDDLQSILAGYHLRVIGGSDCTGPSWDQRWLSSRVESSSSRASNRTVLLEARNIRVRSSTPLRSTRTRKFRSNNRLYWTRLGSSSIEHRGLFDSNSICSTQKAYFVQNAKTTRHSIK